MKIMKYLCMDFKIVYSKINILISFSMNLHMERTATTDYCVTIRGKRHHRHDGLRPYVTCDAY